METKTNTENNTAPRIITHHHCIDGFASAFIAKKYLLKYLNINEDTEVLPVNPTEIELNLIELTEQDIVLDLPKPKQKVLMWIDHHPTSKPRESAEQLREHTATHTEWRNTPSCTGLLIDYLTEKGVPLPPEVFELKKVLDKTDTASYTKEEYEQCFVNINFKDPNLLQQMIILSTVFQTKDGVLNTQMFQDLFTLELGPIPQLSPYFKSPFIHILAKSHFKNLEEWRALMDKNFEKDEKTRTIIQDDRKLIMKKGLPDRFYVSYKFPESPYAINLREKDIDKVAVGISKNIFDSSPSLFDVGQTCKTVGKTFGEGSGGGHKDVGGCVVHKDQANAALKHILLEIENAQLTSKRT